MSTTKPAPRSELRSIFSHLLGWVWKRSLLLTTTLLQQCAQWILLQMKKSNDFQRFKTSPPCAKWYIACLIWWKFYRAGTWPAKHEVTCSPRTPHTGAQVYTWRNTHTQKFKLNVLKKKITLMFYSKGQKVQGSKTQRTNSMNQHHHALNVLVRENCRMSKWDRRSYIPIGWIKQRSMNTALPNTEESC